MFRKLDTVATGRIALSKDLEVKLSFRCTRFVFSTSTLFRTHYFAFSESRWTVMRVSVLFSCTHTCHPCVHQQCWWKPVRKKGAVCKGSSWLSSLVFVVEEKGPPLKSSRAVYKQVYIPRGLHVLDRYIVRACVHVCCIYFFFCLEMYECPVCALVIDVSTFFFTGLWRSIRLPTKCLDKPLTELPPVFPCVCSLRSLCIEHVFRVHACRCMSAWKHVQLKSYCWVKLSVPRLFVFKFIE